MDEEGGVEALVSGNSHGSIVLPGECYAVTAVALEDNMGPGSLSVFTLKKMLEQSVDSDIMTRVHRHGQVSCEVTSRPQKLHFLTFTPCTTPFILHRVTCEKYSEKASLSEV